MFEERVTLVECPRDAMQGMSDFIDTSLKVEYINLLLKCNFDVLDVGSFVSPKAIPQMKDTAEVLDKIQFSASKTELLTIVANLKGAEQAVQYEQISALGYPLSVSNTFQLRNTNKSIEDSFIEFEKIANLSATKGKKVVVYLSMGFGNPYGDYWNPDILAKYISNLTKEFNISTIALSDTIGIATPDLVFQVFTDLNKNSFDTDLSAHLHVIPQKAKEILEAAYNAGCRRFDGAIKGFGGCPMAEDKLTGNMPSEIILEWLDTKNIGTNIDKIAFNNAFNFSSKIFN
ncbi:MAG: hydroxymethylglutaryl-CoA lyase [Crocinitomicaceae bacterium]|jgi:hydroxymethylglutaryl-CoA lyase